MLHVWKSITLCYHTAILFHLAHTIVYACTHTHTHTKQTHSHMLSSWASSLTTKQWFKFKAFFKSSVSVVRHIEYNFVQAHTAKITPDFYFTYNQEWKFYSFAEPFFPFYKNTQNSAHFTTTVFLSLTTKEIIISAAKSFLVSLPRLFSLFGHWLLKEAVHNAITNFLFILTPPFLCKWHRQGRRAIGGKRDPSPTLEELNIQGYA